MQPGAITMSCLITLKEKGMRLTPQRRLIIDLIHDRPSHLTAEEIIHHVQEEMPGINKSTVYRTLDVLEKSGCVYKSEMDDQVIYHHADDHHHHHLTCERCGRTFECGEDITAQLEKDLEKKYGFHAHLQHLVIGGVCQACRRKEG